MSESYRVDLPLVHPNDILYQTAGQRPQRKGGIRFEAEALGQQVVFHNYGHGGAGVSLAPGLALMSIERLEKAKLLKAQQSVAVYGSGYNGLFTAKYLAEKGYQVTLYSREFALESPQRGSCKVASEAAGGLWLPFNYQLVETDNKQMELHDQASLLSLEEYRKLSEQKPSNGVRSMKCFYCNPENQIMIDRFLGNKSLKARINLRKVHLEQANGKPQEVYCFDTYMIECTLFSIMRFFKQAVILLKYLTIQCQTLGVKLVRQEFRGLQLTNESVIVNCMGLGSREVFNDQSLYGSKGQILWLRTQSNIDFMMLYYVDGHCCACFPYQEALGIGVTNEPEENQIPNEQGMNVIIEKWNKLVTQLRSPVPRL